MNHNRESKMHYLGQLDQCGLKSFETLIVNPRRQMNKVVQMNDILCWA